MQLTTKTALLALALSVAAAPIENDKRQFGGSTGALPSLSLPAGTGSALPTGLGSSGSSGLGGLISGSSSLGGLTGSASSSSLTGSTDSSLSGSTSDADLTGLTGSASSVTPSTTFRKRQSFGTGTGTSGISSLTSGLSSSSGSTSGLGSLAGLSGSTGSTSGLSGLTGLTGTGTSTTGTSDISGLTSGLSTSGTSTTTTTSSSSATAASSGDGSCKSISLLFARGTTESGTMGTVIGPPLATALASAAGADKVYTEGVDYPADAAGNANGGATGGAAMAKQAAAILSSCPDTKLVLSGYSQGAMVVHNALSAQGLDASKVAAIVAFGDPFNGQEFQGVDASKCKEFCGSSDFLCSSGGTSGSGGHISYTSDAEPAAEFIVQAVGA